MQIIRIFLVLLAIFGTAFAGNISFLPYKQNEFSPSLNEKFVIPFSISKKGVVKVDIYTPDGSLVRTLGVNGTLKKGKHEIIWDGKDSNAIVVPNEAYNVILRAIVDSKEEILDSRKTSGGIVQRDLKPSVTIDGKITYTLPKPSRVLIRLGINSGAMLRSVINWIPKNSGKNVQFWNGYDQNNLVKIQNHKDFKIIFSAFTLADYSIITTGNTKLSYFDYVEKYSHKTSLESKVYRRDHAKTKLMSPYYVRTLPDMREPVIKIIFPKNIKRDSNNIPILKLGETIRIKVVMDSKDTQRMGKVKYEITFFDNLEFVAEEEMGYVPINWIFSPQNRKGKHILSVNIASFKGHVGVASRSYIVE